MKVQVVAPQTTSKLVVVKEVLQQARSKLVKVGKTIASFIEVTKGPL
jgi:hypothetical protein